jgi:hypothetical protein
MAAAVSSRSPPVLERRCQAPPCLTSKSVGSGKACNVPKISPSRRNVARLRGDRVPRTYCVGKIVVPGVHVDTDLSLTTLSAGKLLFC